MCRLYGVTRAGFYAWRSRERSERERQNEDLVAEIRAAHTESRGTYGSPRVHQVLRGRGHRVGKHRVARLMRRHGIKARVATIRYTSPSLQRYYGSIANQQLDFARHAFAIEVRLRNRRMFWIDFHCYQSTIFWKSSDVIPPEQENVISSPPGRSSLKASRLMSL